jgi:predicted Zn finger-like uncharacterized protein
VLTRCPQCETVFRVSPQQLKVHRGEVRCGRCSTIFDAFDTLLAEAAAPEQFQPAAAESQQATAPAAGETGYGNGPGGGGDTTAPEFDELVPAMEEPADRQPAALPRANPAAAFEPGTPEYSWTKKAQLRRSWPWAILALAATVALILQGTLHYRSEIVVLWPDSRPLLERACAEFRCTVALPRHVELLSIDASDLQVDTAHANLILLTATIKNRAPFVQEYPLLTLTLTDTQDKPMARRVLAPGDYLDRKADAATGFPANAELAIKVFIESREVKATGYRLFLFLP